MQTILLKRSVRTILHLCGPILTLLIMASCGAPNAPATSAGPTPGAPVKATVGTSAGPATATAVPSTHAALIYAFPDDAANTRAATQLIQAYTTANPNVQITAMPLPA